MIRETLSPIFYKDLFVYFMYVRTVAVVVVMVWCFCLVLLVSRLNS